MIIVIVSCHPLSGIHELILKALSWFEKLRYVVFCGRYPLFRDGVCNVDSNIAIETEYGLVGTYLGRKVFTVVIYELGD